MPALLNTDFGPIPDNWRICGEPIEPALRMTSLLAFNVSLLPLIENSTPIAFLFYRIIFSTRTPVKILRFDLFLAGFTYAFEAVSYTHLTLPTICSV